MARFNTLQWHVLVLGHEPDPGGKSWREWLSTQLLPPTMAPHLHIQGLHLGALD